LFLESPIFNRGAQRGQRQPANPGKPEAEGSLPKPLKTRNLSDSYFPIFMKYFCAARMLIYLGLALAIWPPLVSVYYAANKPRTEEIGAQRIYPTDVSHGTIVYLTHGEQAFYHFLSPGLVGGSGVLLIFTGGHLASRRSKGDGKT
jgi:hypothetical protein